MVVQRYILLYWLQNRKPPAFPRQSSRRRFLRHPTTEVKGEQNNYARPFPTEQGAMCRHGNGADERGGAGIQWDV